MPAGALEQYGVRQEDLDGIVEHARSIAGTRMALFFRDLGYGKVKLSFRSTGERRRERVRAAVRRRRTRQGGGRADRRDRSTTCASACIAAARAVSLTRNTDHGFSTHGARRPTRSRAFVIRAPARTS